MIILVDTSEVREGRRAELEALMTELSDFVAASGTRALLYNMYLSADGDRMTVVQAHRDSESVEAQMNAARHIFARFADLLTMTAMDVYGRPTPALLEILRRKADLLGLGRPPTLHDLHSGFDRLGGG